MKQLLGVLMANLNALAFAIGLGVLCVSVAAWSPPSAGVILGLVLMTLAAWPYVLLMMRKP